MLTASQRQHRIPEFPPRSLQPLRILQPHLLKRRESVRTEHLSPLVTVVPGRIASSKNMGE